MNEAAREATEERARVDLAEPYAVEPTAPPAVAAPREPGLVERLGVAIRSPRGERIARWALPAGVLAVAAATRLTNLGEPHALVFDETYYVKDSFAIWQLGFESQWDDDANDRFLAGDSSAMQGTPSFVVHPPLGKWVLGIGMALWGIDDAAAWRLPIAIVGILLVAATMALATGITRSVWFGSLAGLLLAIDGQAIVMSRTVLLDGLLALLVVCAAGCVLLDRRGSPARLVRWRAAHPRSWLGPALFRRPWLLAAGALLGAACAVKWSGAYFLAAFGLWTVLMDALDRRRAGIPGWHLGTLVTQGPASFLLMVPGAVAVYVGSFAGWFQGGYQSQWAQEHPGERFAGALEWVPLPLQSLWHYHQSVLQFHVGLTDDHPFQSPAIEWMAMLRPTAFDLVEHDGVMRFIAALPNPLIWYGSVVALVFLIFHLGHRLDRVAGFLIVAIAAGWVPWLWFPDRTIFAFYSIVFEPFLIIGLAYAMWLWVRGGRPGSDRRLSGRITTTILVVVAIAMSIFFAPIWYGMWDATEAIRWRFWLPGWR